MIPLNMDKVRLMLTNFKEEKNKICVQMVCSVSTERLEISEKNFG